MNGKWITAIAAAALIAPAGVQAQSGGTAAASAERRLVEKMVSGTQVISGAVETRTTIGRPYAAESTSEMVQVLGDGNRINRRSVTRVYRDGEGRTRRETLNDDGTVRSIAISDPVAHTSYTLDPQTKVAYKARGNVVMPLRTPGYVIPSSPGNMVEQERPAVAARGGGGGRGGAGVGMLRSTARDNPNVQREELAPQNIEGVMATGTRTTTTIPAGEIGNTQEIRILSEQWFSDDLQVLVMTKHSDPRSGENTYRLRNIVRAEPDPSLFTVPADYTIQQRGIRQPE